MSCDVADLYLKKTLEVEWGGRRLELDVPVDVFSSFQVDRGTQLLLRAIEQAGPRWRRALDLGCGYGPIALWLAATGAADEVQAVDRDALAVLFTRRNAERNGLGNVLARGGLAYDDLPAPAYDAVVTNLPAKAGEGVHRLVLLGAAGHSAEGSEVWAVVVRPLEERIDAILADEAVRVLDKVRRKEHVVYRYAFAGRPDVPAEPYRRGDATFAWRSHSYTIAAVHGLPEFDTLSHATEAVVAVAERVADPSLHRILVWNPGQGHLPILLSRLCPAAERFDLVSRDLLALRAARANLAAVAPAIEGRAHHTPDLAAPERDGLGLVIGLVNEAEGVDVTAALLGRARERYPGAPMLVGCTSSFAARLTRRLKEHGLRATVARKRRGACAVACT